MIGLTPGGDVLDLQEIYDSANIKDRISKKRRVLVVCSEKGEDISNLLSSLEISADEVAVTWPKDGISLEDEISAYGAKFVVRTTDDITDAFKDSVKYDGGIDYFVNLHHHDEFSIKDGLGTVEQLCKLLVKNRQCFCCVTNHGGVGGWIKQYNACRKYGLKAIFGMEAYTNDYRGDDPELRKQNRSANHLILIANNEEGFYNIIRIHNDAQLNGFYYTPRVNREACRKWGRGITATSSCMAGEIPRLLNAGEEDKALELAEFYRSCFDCFLIEIQLIESEEQRETNRRLIQFAKKHGFELIVACDSHYLDPSYSDTHEILMLSRQKKTLNDARESDDTWTFDVKNLYYRNTEQISDLFDNGWTDASGTHKPFKDDVFTDEVFGRAVGMTLAVARGCAEISLDSTIKLPKIYEDGPMALRKRINEGFRERNLQLKPNVKEYVERLKHEYGIITKLGWADYILTVDKIIKDARDKFGSYATGMGRGSAGGSLVCYCLGITDADPIKYNLLFERFIDESRTDCPDIDTDFRPDIRDWVKEHIKEIFGEKHVCSIGTYQTYKTKAVIVDVARVLGLDVHEAMEATKPIDVVFDVDEEDWLKIDSMGFDELCDHFTGLRDYFAKYPKVRHHAEILRNQVKNMGTHAGGVIISDLDLTDRIPLLYDKPGAEDRKIVSAWAESGSAQELSSVGLVKFDLLGLNNLPILEETANWIYKTTGKKIEKNDIPVDDEKSITNSAKKDLTGIFQFENPMTRKIADAVEINNLDDIAAVTSLIRPGPMGAEINGVKMPFEYARRKHGGEYDAPEFMKEALSKTYGLMPFQEDIMRISRVLAGFTGGEANKLRKACSKKKKDLMEEMKVKFIKGAQKRVDAGEITSEEVDHIFSQIQTFAGYGFNKSHALCYGMVTAAELWFKLKYPVQFFTALLNNTDLSAKKMGNDNVFGRYLDYVRSRGIVVRGVDINKSEVGFSTDGTSIFFGLGHVKNVGSSAGDIVAGQPYSSLEDFVERAKPNARVAKGLLYAGAFGCWGTKNEVSEMLSKLSTPKVQATQESEESLKSLARDLMSRIVAARDEGDITSMQSLALELSRVNRKIESSMRKKSTPKKQQKQKEFETHTEEEWDNLEIEYTGLVLSRPPVYLEWGDMIDRSGWFMPSNVKSAKRKQICVFGKLTVIKERTSKNGNQLHIATITDGLAKMEFYIFAGQWQYFQENFSEGDIGVFPMSKFDDGDTRFFSDKFPCTILKKA